ncbi:transcriptional regulator [Sinorhizobium meliloti]|nr:transcriptional regulator [Sinorhizobium meliloti]RVJ06898.1 transcriptional regulator [Sinorhizobium meliloti]
MDSKFPEKTIDQLAEAAAVSTNTIVRFVRGEEFPRTVADIRSFFEKACLAFIDGDYQGSGGSGVRLSK